MKLIIEVNGIEKSFNNYQALKGVTFHINAGEILCLLGPNGAGKSTTINILSSVLRYDRGEVLFDGERVEHQLHRYKQNLGIVPQDLAIYEEITAEKNVSFFASLYGLRGKELQARVDEALEFVGLLDRKGDKPKTFSGGMKRRLNIACAIAHRPQVVIMDEPTVGIDAQSRNHILASIKELRDQGTTILYTTHYMEEVEEISDRIIIIDYGEIIASGTKEELKEQLEDEKWYEVEVEDLQQLSPEELYGLDGVKDVEMQGNLIRLSTLKGIENLDKIIAFLMNKGIRIKNFNSTVASLEMVFLKLTGRKLRN